MNNPSIVLRRGTGVLLLLFLVLALLKGAGLTRVASWSWWAVTSPLWGLWALLAVLAGLGVAWAMLIALLRKSTLR